MEDGSIRTQIDDILSALKGAGGKPVSVPALSSASGMPEKDILKWLHTLEKDGQVRLENHLVGVFASWVEKAHHRPVPHKHQASGSAPISQNAGFEQGLSIAREQEAQAKAQAAPPKHIFPEPEPGQAAGPEAPRRHKVALESADMQMAEVGEQLEKVESMIAVLRMQKKIARQLRQKIAEKKASKGARTPKEAAPAAPQDAAAQPEAIGPQEGETAQSHGEIPVYGENEIPIETGDKASGPGPEIENKEEPESIVLEIRKSQLENQAEAHPGFASIKPLSTAKKAKKDRIKKPEPIHVAGVSLQFSERLARQVKRIIGQTQEIDRLHLEKENLLTGHYLPMQRKLESEIETISDRVLRMEKNIIGMQERASNLPNKVSSVEKLQLSSIKAHGQMRRAYDEASALIEESARELSEERERMEVLVEQSRQEIASHRSKTIELEQALSRITELELESSDRVIEARASLSEQAERLASAEQHAQELGELKNEIAGGVSSIKREISATKAVITNIEKQMEQVRQVELYSQSLRSDYEQKMGELGDYVKHGNEDFDTLRESVEANFVRRYLKELRELTDSYGFEFEQAKKAEGSIDGRIADEKKKLEGLLEEGKRIAHLYELQSKEVQGAESFEQRGEKLAEVEQLAEKRTRIEGMIAQIVGGRSAHQLRAVASTPIKIRRHPKPKAKAAKAKKNASVPRKAKAPAKKARKKKGKR